jgi:hypothetical protein
VPPGDKSGAMRGAVVEVVDGDRHVATLPMDRGISPDLVTVDTLARLQLVVRRLGWSMRLRNPCAELASLLDLVGLADVIAVVDDGLPLEASRQAEGGEKGCVEEVVQRDDPVA